MDQILEQLDRIRLGQRVSIIEIGELTYEQHQAINRLRLSYTLPVLESPRIVYLRTHHYRSRSADGYTIHDMAQSLVAALCSEARVIPTHKMTALQPHAPMTDNYGIQVRPMAILELTARKPRAEAYSIIPKGDEGGPAKKKQSPS